MYSGLEGVYGGLDGPRSYHGGDKYDRRPGINPVNRELTSCEGKNEENASEELILRSVNFHGQQLASFMKETDVMRQVDTKKIDYHLYQQRSRDLKLEDRGKRLLLHRFIAQKASVLFHPGDVRTSRRTLENDQTEDHAALLPPLEVFADVQQEDRAKQFFKAMEVGDTLYCRVQHKTPSGLILFVLALDPVTGKSRYVEDIKIRGFCPSAEMVPAVDPRSPDRSYEADDVVRVAVLEMKPESERFLAGMQTESLPPDLQTIVKLGLVPDTDLPSSLKFARQALDGGLRYEECLAKSIGFINPNNVAHLTAELGLDNRRSFMADLDGNYPAKHYASALKKAQNSKWAFKHVHNGIKHFKANNKIEAFQCLNQALNIDPVNVEGLVARGALYANNNGLEKAIEDFEAALKINASHQNAKKYLCETLIAVGRNFEDDKNFTAALETYERIVRIAPDHKEANDSIYYLKGRPQDRTGQEGAIPGLGPDDAPLYSQDKLKFTLDGDKDQDDRGRKKKKRKRSKSGGSVSSGTSDERRRSSKKPRDRGEEEPRGSVSPLSRRAALHHATRPISPFSAKLAPTAVHAVPAGGAVGMNPAEVYPPADNRSPARGTISVLSATSNPDRPGQSSFDLSQPPPGYLQPGGRGPPPPGYQDHYAQKRLEDSVYNDKVEWFLRQTQAAPLHRDRRDVDRRDKRYTRRSRSRSRGRGRRRSGSRDYRSTEHRRGESRELRREDSRELRREDSRELRREESRELRREESRELRRDDSRERTNHYHSPRDRTVDVKQEEDFRMKEEQRREEERKYDEGRRHDEWRTYEEGRVGEERRREEDGRRNEEVRRKEEEEGKKYEEEMMRNFAIKKEEKEESSKHGSEKKKEEKEESSSHGSEKKKKSEKSKRSLSPLLGLVEDEELKKKLKEHLYNTGAANKSEEKKKKKKKSRSKSRSKNRKESGKKKVKDKNETIEITSSEEDMKKKKKKKKDKKDSPSPARRKSGEKKDLKDSPEKKTPEVKGSVFNRLSSLNIPNKSKAKGGIWIPTGEDSMQESINQAVLKMEAYQKKNEERDPPKSKFDPHKKISMSLDAPAPAKDYDVTYDPKIGMYIRVPKQAPTQTKAEEVASLKKSRMDTESKKVDSDVEEIKPEPKEQRFIRSVASPEKSKSRSKERRRSRSKSKAKRSRSRGKRSKSRSKSKDKRSRSRSKSRGKRSRSKSRGKNSRSYDKSKRSRSRDRSRRSRSRSRDKGRRSGDLKYDLGDLKHGGHSYRGRGGYHVGFRGRGGHDRRGDRDDRRDERRDTDRNGGGDDRKGKSDNDRKGGSDYDHRKGGNDHDRKGKSGHDRKGASDADCKGDDNRKRIDYDSQLTDLRDETQRLKHEREAIEREKAALMAAEEDLCLHKVMDSVLDVVGKKDVKKEKLELKKEKVDVKKEKLPEPENVADFLKRKKKEKSEK